MLLTLPAGRMYRSDLHADDGHVTRMDEVHVGWLRAVGSIKLQVSFAKEPYKRDYILQKRRMIYRSY